MRYILQKKFFHEKLVCGPPQGFFLKISPVVPLRSVFRRKKNFAKYITFDVDFCADSEYAIYFAFEL